MQESEIKYRTLFEQAADAIILIDPESGELIEFNNKAHEQLGYTRDEFKKLKIPDFEVIESPDDVKSHFKKILRDGFDAFETKHRTKDGEIRDIYVSAKSLSFRGKKFIQTIWRDITERNKVENKLRFHASLIEIIYDAVITLDMNFNILSWNKAAERMYGWKANEVIGKDFKDIIPVEFLNDKSENVLRIFFEKGYWSGEGIQHHKDGTPINVLTVSVIIKDRDGKNSSMVSFNRDITERKKAEKELTDLAKFPSENPNPVLRVTKEKVLYVNSVGQTLFDTQEENSIPKIFRSHVNDSFLKNINQKFELVLQNKVYSFTITLIKDAGYANLYGIDITELKKAEEKLKESEARYRESYEQAEFYKDLFAHDISNILQNIKSSLDLLLMWRNKPEATDKIKELTDIINDQVIRGSKLVSNIRKLSEISEVELRIESIEALQILKEAIKFIQKSFPEKEIDIRIESQIKAVNVKANQILLDVFENILFNSIKYNENKKIEIIIKISKEVKNSTKNAKFQFIDNGIGVPDVMKKRIFEGISARKEKTHGMGLGLLLVKKVLSSYNGDIWVEDKVQGKPSQGSNFVILIPEVV
jgi:PAS domain S-box-containing protein